MVEFWFGVILFARLRRCFNNNCKPILPTCICCPSLPLLLHSTCKCSKNPSWKNMCRRKMCTNGTSRSPRSRAKAGRKSRRCWRILWLPCVGSQGISFEWTNGEQTELSKRNLSGGCVPPSGESGWIWGKTTAGFSTTIMRAPQRPSFWVFRNNWHPHCSATVVVAKFGTRRLLAVQQAKPAASGTPFWHYRGDRSRSDGRNKGHTSIRVFLLLRGVG